MPPRKQKRKNEREDQEMDRAEGKSKWAQLIEQEQQQQQQPDASALYQQQKAIFSFDFSQEHLLRNQKQPPKREPPKIILTPEQQQQLQLRKAKQKQEREEKQKLRKEKQSERKQQLDREKQEERQRKEEQEKEETKLGQILENNKNKKGDTLTIFYCLLAGLLLLGALQYQSVIYVKLAQFRIDPEINHYAVLEIANSATEGELKTQYRRLVLKYHPDKNPNCKTCKDKFNSIMQAWEVLGNPDKRQNYDKNSGFIKQIPSDTLTLTPDNYHHLLGDSDAVWVVQVCDSTEKGCHYFAQFWEEMHGKYKGVVNFGRIDVWQQSEMKGYIPYKFQIFPGLYTSHRGEEKLCQFSFERAVRSIEICIESAVQGAIKKINDVKSLPLEGKRAVVLGGGVALSTRMKLVHAKYSRYFDYYTLVDSSNNITVTGSGHRFEFAAERGVISKYSAFLGAHVVQDKSMCETQYLCRDHPCLLLLEEVSHEGLTAYPLIRIAQREYFMEKIQQIKEAIGMHEKFDIGVYQDGKIQLGYFNEIEHLLPENGEVIDLPCIEATLFRTIRETVITLIDRVTA